MSSYFWLVVNVDMAMNTLLDSLLGRDGPQGRYFYIVSRLNSLVLAVEGETDDVWGGAQFDDDSDQLWYEDRATGTIRTKSSNYCMEISSDGSTLVVNPYAAGNPNQQWAVVGEKIQCRHDRNKVLDIADEQRTPGATICAWSPHGGPNQSWRLDYTKRAPSMWNASCAPGSRVITASRKRGGAGVPGGTNRAGHMLNTALGKVGLSRTGAVQAPAPAPVRTHPMPQSGGLKSRPFYIRSEMNGRVLDIGGCNRNPGAQVIMYDKKVADATNQLWYFDESSVIHSYLNDFALDPTGNSTTMQPFVASNPNHQWIYDGRKIYNPILPNQVLDISAANQDNFANVIKYAYKGSANQHWVVDYV